MPDDTLSTLTEYTCKSAFVLMMQHALIFERIKTRLQQIELEQARSVRGQPDPLAAIAVPKKVGVKTVVKPELLKSSRWYHYFLPTLSPPITV